MPVRLGAIIAQLLRLAVRQCTSSYCCEQRSHTSPDAGAHAEAQGWHRRLSSSYPAKAKPGILLQLLEEGGRCRILSVRRLQGSASRSVALQRPRGGGELAPTWSLMW